MTLMTPFSEFKIVPTYTKNSLVLQWDLDPVFQDVGPYEFTVEVSESAKISPVLYSLPAGNQFYAVDENAHRQGNAISFYYRVKLQTASNKVYYSATLGHWVSPEEKHRFTTAQEIIRKDFVRFRYTGLPGWLLKRKNYGEKDPDVLDPITGLPLRHNAHDQGTGFSGGYYSPLAVTCSRENVKRVSTLSQEGFGTSSQEIQVHRYVGFPIVTPYDVFVTRNNQRFQYKDVEPFYMPGTDLLLVQIAQGALLPPTDPVYNIPTT